jgi:hypothetical protein
MFLSQLLKNPEILESPLTFTFSLPLKSENLILAQFSKKASVFGKDNEVNPYIRK